MNPNCVTSLDIQVERVGGTVSFLVVFFLFLTIALLTWVLISARSSCIQKSHKDNYATVYSGVLFSDMLDEDEDDIVQQIGPQSLQMRDSDIWSHTHRMYFIGENSVNYPWFMTRDFPSNCLSE